MRKLILGFLVGVILSSGCIHVLDSGTEDHETLGPATSDVEIQSISQEESNSSVRIRVIGSEAVELEELQLSYADDSREEGEIDNCFGTGELDEGEIKSCNTEVVFPEPNEEFLFELRREDEVIDEYYCSPETAAAETC